MEFLTFLVFLGCMYSILTSSFGLLMGLGRQFSMAHAGMWGLGAYASAYVTLKLEWPLWWGVPVALLAGALAGALVAIPALRVGVGVYLAIVTFAFQMVFVNMLRNLTELTGGSHGMAGMPAFPAVGTLSTTQTVTLYTAIAAAAALLLTHLWRHGSYGRVLLALGRDEKVLEGLGRDVRWLKIQLFAITGALGSLAGVFYAQYLSFISPDSFTVHESILVMTMLLIGGAFTTLGPVVGAWFFVLVPELLTRLGLPDSVAAALQQILFGLLLVVFMIFRPQGIVAPRRRRQRRPPGNVDAHSGTATVGAAR
ncbi:MAG: branched-chain amino acid ABC transporter permease [Micromonosporaceae bacterium]|nr:branched-chain amino acid ABC transporter permease [Micromonosporaceae bacterium]